jgi:hypothetical protein
LTTRSDEGPGSAPDDDPLTVVLRPPAVHLGPLPGQFETVPPRGPGWCGPRPVPPPRARPSLSSSCRCASPGATPPAPPRSPWPRPPRPSAPPPPRRTPAPLLRANSARPRLPRPGRTGPASRAPCRRRALPPPNGRSGAPRRHRPGARRLARAERRLCRHTSAMRCARRTEWRTRRSRRSSGPAARGARPDRTRGGCLRGTVTIKSRRLAGLIDRLAPAGRTGGSAACPDQRKGEPEPGAAESGSGGPVKFLKHPMA